MTVLEMIDPATLTIDANVRADAQLDKAFLASLKEHGVIQPVVAHRAEDGGAHVLYGQRRTLAVDGRRWCQLESTAQQCTAARRVRSV